MPVATSAIERLQGVAERAGAITPADERATAAELHLSVAAVHGAATFYDDLARTLGASGTSVSARAPHVSRPTGAGMSLRSNEHSASPLAPVARTVRCRCRRCAALASAMRRPLCWTGLCHTPALNWPPS